MRCQSLFRGLSCSAFILVLAGPVHAQDSCDQGPRGPDDIDYLVTCRPAPVTLAEAAAAMQVLPAEGTVTHLTPAQRVKLEAIRGVIGFHKREGIYRAVVVDVPQAWIGLHARSVVLISRPLLDHLDGDELAGLVAHEIGHEYLLRSYEAARGRKDHAWLRRIEASCDAIAALTVSQIGVPVTRLVRAVEKMYWFNRMRFGPADERAYPSVDSRRAELVRYGAAGSPDLRSAAVLTPDGARRAAARPGTRPVP